MENKKSTKAKTEKESAEAAEAAAVHQQFLAKLNDLLETAKKKSLFSGVMDEFLDDIGIRDIQDEFTEMGNEFREEFGLKTKMTHAERKELEELEEKRRKQEIQQQKNSTIQNRVNQQKAMIDAKKAGPTIKQAEETSKMSVKEQMDLLQQIKSLLDAGVLTQEEFDKKKQEILNS